MKITAASRNRIAEIITGALIIVLTLSSVFVSLSLYAPGFDFSGIPTGSILMLSIYVAASLFYVIVGAMIIFRAYRFLPMKLIYCITGLAVLASSSGGLYIRGLLGDDNFGDISTIPPPYVIRFIAEMLIIAAAIVIAFLTMNRKIVWITPAHLLTYSYIAIGLLAIIRAMDWTSVVVILLPCFMQESAEKKDIKGIVGNVSLIVMGILPLAATFVQNLLSGSGTSFTGLLTGESSSGSSNSAFTSALKVILVILAFLAPLMVCERECRASGMLTKKAPSRRKNKEGADSDE
jgi:hypothetical protein